MSITTKSSNKVNGGVLHKLSFESLALGGLTTQVNVFVPPSAASGAPAPVPVLYFLAGLTCTEDNAAQKGNLFATAAEEGVGLVFPDTSPRGAGIEGEDESYDFGSGAGFYVNATKQPWARHYRMYEYIVSELPARLKASGLPLVRIRIPPLPPPPRRLTDRLTALQDTSRASITGHSMGGHGALTLYLREQTRFRSCSAFAPICHPTACPWGQKAFQGYLAGGTEEGKAHDATLLIANQAGKRRLDILIDSGTADDFYKQNQLLPEAFADAAKKAGFGDDQVNVRLQDGYDHSCTSNALASIDRLTH